MRVEISYYYGWDNGTWQLYSRDSAWVRLVGNTSLVDSVKIYYPTSGGGWDNPERIDFTYDSQNRLVRQHYVSRENPDTSLHMVQKLFYEATAPGRLQRDSMEIYQVDEIGPGAPKKINMLRAERRHRYIGSSTKVSVDSAQVEVFLGTWLVVYGSKNTYTYNSTQADSLSERVFYENPTSSGYGGPWRCSERYRYIRRRVARPTSLAEGSNRLPIPTLVRAGEWVQLPLPAGERWTLYTMLGQEVTQGEATPQGASFLAPPQSGLYFLQVRDHTYKLLITP